MVTTMLLISDAVRADSPTEALEAARANWPGATVALVEQPLTETATTMNGDRT